MATPNIPSPDAPAALRWLLLALLPLIAFGLYLDGQNYSGDLLEFRPNDSAASNTLLPARLGGQAAFGPLRQFNKDNLYEYINGHAEYYLGAGFVSLTVGEYGTGGDGQARAVVNLYDMGNALNAFGALTHEAGEQESVEIGQLGFRNEKGASFIHGPYYVQISLFDPLLPLLDMAREMADALAAQSSGTALAFHFPDLGSIQNTRFVREYYRGMDFLHNVLERSFLHQGLALQAFLVADPEHAVSTKLRRFLDSEDIEHQASEHGGLSYVAVSDPYEGDWFFVPLPQQQLLGVYAPLDDTLISRISAFAAPSSVNTANTP
jgi:hypothetical protein